MPPRSGELFEAGPRHLFASFSNAASAGQTFYKRSRDFGPLSYWVATNAMP